MNIETVKSLFLLFSGESDANAYMPMIELAQAEVFKMLRSDADKSDLRLEFLCAAIANLRLQQCKAAHDRTSSTFVGRMSTNTDTGAPLRYASKLVSEYINICSDLINCSTFVFAGFSDGREELSNA